MNVSRLLKHIGLWGVSAAALALAAPDAQAQSSASSNIAVTASVARTCSIQTVDMNFGSYDPVTTHATDPLDVNGSVTITCTKGTSTRIDLGPGGNAGQGSGTTRAMAGGDIPDFLNYDLYKDTNHTIVWASGTGPGGNTGFNPPNAPDRTARTYPIYGRIPAGQDRSTGAYSDTVQATVHF